MTITFSSRVHESAVQFVEPVHSVSPSRIDVLVVHQVGHAGDRGGREGQRLEQAPDPSRGGGGTGTSSGSSRLYASRTATPRAAAPVERVEHDRRERVRQPDVVDRDLERVLRGRR